MKPALLLVLACATLPALAQHNHAIGGCYPTKTTETIQLPFNQVWEKLLVWFERTDNPVQLSDRTAGVLDSGPIQLTWCFENDDNTLQNPDAAVVWPDRVEWKDGGTIRILVTPTATVGELTFHLKDNGDSTTTVTIAVQRIRATGSNAQGWPLKIAAQSTGKLEKKLLTQLKG